MTYVAKPKLHHPTLPKNKLGYTRRDYEGKVSTLCAGCGHDSISAALIQAFWELDIQPHRVAKLSGIGCSSKTPDYFLGNSHGFNTVHGRMPSVLTGANLANRDLIYLGVSGDGDSASIGLGQFAHVMRRGVNMTYILENNGVYGLTKGQFSATADKGSKAKKGAINTDSAIDTVSLALLMGATFVARSFCGDKAPARPAGKGRHRPPGRRLHRRHQPLRRLQQPPRQHQELRLLPRAQRGRQPPRLLAQPRGHHRRLQPKAPSSKSPGPTAASSSSASFHADYDPTDKISAMTQIARAGGEGRGADRPAVPRARRRRPPRAPQYLRGGVQHARGEGVFARGRGCWRRSTPGLR